MQRIGRYEIVGELGRGAAGSVYRARDPQRGRDVAIKVLNQGAHAPARQRQRFEREAKALLKVDHPHVVRLRDVGEHDGCPYLVLVELASGLTAAHEVQVLHRDLKPENVLVSATGRALLSDFGLTKDLARVGETEQLTKTGVLVGTPGYWAPEQVAGRPEAMGPPTDIYGLGATLYAALSGQPPHEGETLIEIASRTLHEEPAPLRSLRPDLPPALATIVQRCLAKEPEARWTSAAELEGALHAYLAGSKAGGRRQAGLLVGAVAVTLILAAGLALATRGEPPELAAVDPPPSPTTSESPSPTPSEPIELSADERYAQARELILAQRYAEAIEALRPLAEQEHVEAMSHLGAMLAFDWEGAPKQEQEALRWTQRAADMGFPQAMCNLGWSYENGHGTPQDMEQALTWYRRAADLGNAGAMRKLGELLLVGAEDDAARLAGAATWLELAADEGDTEAMVLFAQLLETGRGVERKRGLAVEYYQRAVDEGDPDDKRLAREGLQRLREQGFR
jgi:hypothetical protein